MKALYGKMMAFRILGARSVPIHAGYGSHSEPVDPRMLADMPKINCALMVYPDDSHGLYPPGLRMLEIEILLCELPQTPRPSRKLLSALPANSASTSTFPPAKYRSLTPRLTFLPS